MAQAAQDDIRRQLIEALEDEAPKHNIDIVDVEVVGSAKNPTVRVRIDHADGREEGITLDEVSAETAWISDLIDAADPIEGSYMLEVSSPGMARPLRKPHDFERFAGQTVSVTLNVTEGRRRYTGKLIGYADGTIRVETDEGPCEFKLEDLRSCTIKPEFETAGRKEGGARRGKGKGRR